MASVLPNDVDWDKMAELSGDSSWSAASMREIFVKIEKNLYLGPGDSTANTGHGFAGLVEMGQGASSFYQTQPERLALLSHFAEDLTGKPVDEVTALSFLERDANFAGPARDKAAEPFGLPNNINRGRRWSPRDLIKDTLGRSFTLTLALESLATKILFDTSTAVPRATGVEYLEGAGVYGATWGYRAATAPKGTKKTAFARREVILSGGTFNTLQLLQLSGIGDASLLNSLSIPVIVDLPACRGEPA